MLDDYSRYIVDWNVVKLKNCYLPWELERELHAFVQYYNHERVHESLNNLTPADVYEG